MRSPPPALTDAVFEELASVGLDTWNAFVERKRGAFQHFIPADYGIVRSALEQHRGRANAFLELGSGVGIVAILADLMGFEACGIEIEPELVETSLQLAGRFRSSATLVEGSFVPTEFREDVEHLSGDFLTLTEGADAYAELGMELRDFDLVYAYPWPGEEDWFAELLRRFGAPNATLLTYSVSDGVNTASVAEL